MEATLGTAIPSKSNNKLLKILKHLLDPNFKLGNNFEIDGFIKYLFKVTVEQKNENLTREYSEEFCEWLIEASNLWEGDLVGPPAVLLSLALNLASKLSSNEQLFVQLNCQNIYERFVGVAQNNANSDVMLGLVALFSSFLEHKSGIQWVIATSYWTDVVKYGKSPQNVALRKKSYHFVTKLLQNTVSSNKKFCRNLVAYLIKPVQDGLKKHLMNCRAGQIQEQSFFKHLRPNLVFISEVCDALARNSNNSVMDIFIDLKTFDITKEMRQLSDIEDLSFELLKIETILFLHKTITLNQAQNDQVTRLTLEQCKTMLNVIWEEICKDHIKCVIKNCHYMQTLYSSMPGKVTDWMRRDDTIKFQNQLMLLQLLPLLIFLQDQNINKPDEEHRFGLRKEYTRTLFTIGSFNIIRMGLQWKGRLAARSDFIELQTFALVYLMKSKKAFDKERAALVLVPLITCLHKSLGNIKEQENFSLSSSQALHLNTLIEAIMDLVESFDLTWKDTMATFCVMNLAYDFLQLPYWNENLIVSCLGLLNLAISRYMAPDMVLLLDTRKDTLLSFASGLLLSKCQDSKETIRTAALEIVHTLSLNASSKFPSFTNVLLDVGLPQLVLEIAYKDCDSSVRLVAFKVLSELVKIEEVWDIFLASEKFMDNILKALERECEAAVRKEIVTMTAQIQKYHSFPSVLLPRLYDVMSSMALYDWDSKVRLSALCFWFNVFETHLNNQGMLDREFPEMTFSKEQRKIVILNEAEIRRRLIKVLNQLAGIGCLYVLKNACSDKEAAVAKRTISVTQEIVNLYRAYKVPCENVDSSELPSHCIKQKPSSLDRYCSPSPASSTTLSASECGDLDTSFLDDISLGSAPCTHLDFDLLSLSPSSDYQSLLFHDTRSANTWNHSIGSSDNNKSPTDGNCDIEMIDDAGKLDTYQIQVQKIMEDLMSCSQKPEQMCPNPFSEKKCIYLAPSDYLKFIYQLNPSEAVANLQAPDDLQEFNTFLTRILVS